MDDAEMRAENQDIDPKAMEALGNFMAATTSKEKIKWAKIYNDMLDEGRFASNEVEKFSTTLFSQELRHTGNDKLKELLVDSLYVQNRYSEYDEKNPDQNDLCFAAFHAILDAAKRTKNAELASEFYSKAKWIMYESGDISRSLDNQVLAMSILHGLNPESPLQCSQAYLLEAFVENAGQIYRFDSSQYLAGRAISLIEQYRQNDKDTLTLQMSTEERHEIAARYSILADLAKFTLDI